MFHRAKRVIGVWIPTGQIRDCHPRELETELEEGKLERKEAEERGMKRKESLIERRSALGRKVSTHAPLLAEKAQKSLRGKISSLLV